MANIYNPAGQLNLPFNSTSANNLLTTSGSNGTYTTTSWAQSNTNFVSSNQKPIMTIPHGGETVVLEEAATLEVKGNVRINGQDLEERLSTIEKVLQIPTRDVIMEAKYPRLADLYAEYMQELEKYKTWERLK